LWCCSIQLTSLRIVPAHASLVRSSPFGRGSRGGSAEALLRLCCRSRAHVVCGGAWCVVCVSPGLCSRCVFLLAFVHGVCFSWPLFTVCVPPGLCSRCVFLLAFVHGVCSSWPLFTVCVCPLHLRRFRTDS
jgi:hypothetical protein